MTSGLEMETAYSAFGTS